MRCVGGVIKTLQSSSSLLLLNVSIVYEDCNGTDVDDDDGWCDEINYFGTKFRPEVRNFGLGSLSRKSLLEPPVGISLFKIPGFLIGYRSASRQDGKIPTDSCPGSSVGFRQG
jgi:hypothetical protein